MTEPANAYSLLPSVSWLNTFPVVLASQSPRRRELLTTLGINFQIQTADIIETGAHLPTDPPLLSQVLAVDKAKAIRKNEPDSVIIAADTVVAYHGHSIGKPETPEEAKKMLRKLSDHQHQVYTGLAILFPGHETDYHLVEQTDVRFRHLSDEEIACYVATGSPMDKAGGYGIQDGMAATFIMGIKGDYYNVVGFPVRRFYELITEIRNSVT